MSWYLEVLRKYTIFEGRARRREYWSFFLFNMIASVFLTIIDVSIGTFSPSVGMGLLGTLYALFLIMPSIAVSVRRLHDTNRSGWWLLVALIPLVGGVVLLVFMVQDSMSGSNLYGTNPKDIIV